MANLGGYKWLCKTSMFISHFPFRVKIKMTIGTQTPVQFSSVQFVWCKRGFKRQS